MMLHAPWTVHTDPNPADPILIGFRIRDARGVVVAEIFNRPYPVVVDRAHADALAAVPHMLTALRLALPVCEDAYCDAKILERCGATPEAKQSTAAALAAWQAVSDAIALAEGRQPEPLELPEDDTPDATDAPKVEPAPADFEQRRDGWLIAFVPISSAARQWSIDANPKGARWEHERWYTKRDRAPAVRHAIEAEGFIVR